MKKLLGIVVLGLLWSNTGFADNLKVIDGDTIILNGEKIRFSGIDAPEYDQDCMNGDKKIYCGMFATVLLTKKIGDETPKISSPSSIIVETQINKSILAFLVFSSSDTNFVEP